MKLLLLLGTICLTGVYAGYSHCKVSCGQPLVKGCSCSALCGGYHTEGCCSDYSKYCGGQYYPIPLKPDVYDSSSNDESDESCENPGEISNGYHSGGLKKYFAVGSKISYACKRGYSLIGESERTCTPSKEFQFFPVPPHWSQEVPKCEISKRCLNIECGAHAMCDDGICVCHEGYTDKFGDGCKDKCYNVTCGDNAVCVDGECRCAVGYTRHQSGACKEIRPCDSISCGFQSSCIDIDASQYKCQCNAGFSAYGKTGKCRKNCLSPPNPENGMYTPMKNAYRYRSVINFRCNPGYTLIGRMRARCKFNGKFSQARCEDINECVTSPCDKNSKCINIPGSYRCEYPLTDTADMA